MEVASIRINKVLKELNVSLDRVVDFLNDKGYEIEVRPTSKITERMYETLLDEFQTDRSKRIQSDKVAEKKEKEKKEILDEIVKTEEVVKAKAVTVTGLKVVDKIDLKPAEKHQEDKISEKVIEEKKEKDVPKEVEKKTLDKKEEDGILKARTKRLSGPILTGQVVDLKQFEKKPKPVQKETETKKEPEQKKRKRIRFQNPKSNSGGESNQRKDNRGRNRNATPKAELTDEEIQKQVRETLEKLQGKGNKSKGAKYRREKRDIHRQKTDDTLQQQEADSKILKVTEFVTLSEMAVLMDTPVNNLISACMSLGIMVTMNQRLDAETLSIVAEEFGYEVEFTTDDIDEVIEEVEDSLESLKPRAPIVTVMGHVDHGKTSLLDYIRSSNVIAGESGGITQHIDAYAVQLDNGQKITFLDTPGHEAFTAMRARGSQVTDIAIVVVAADDGVMPQTKEAISHAQAAGVPIIFAINKVDRPTANPDKIKEQLSTMNLLVDDWGGKIQSQDISAKTGVGVNQLLEKVLLESELLELKANPNRPAQGTVVDALLDKGRGYVSTILVELGTLKVGDYVLAGKHSGKVKAMQDERRHNLEAVGPSTPVSILGLDGAPQGGDKFYVFSDEKEAKQMADKRSQLHREQSVRTQKHITLDEIGRRIALGEFKELNIILKGDVDGSVEALTGSIQKLSTEEIQVNIIHKGVGAITESDVLLASASDAIIIGFNVRPTGNSRTIADREEIDIRMYSIIYDAINDLKDAIEGMLSPEIKEEITGTAEIRQTFKVSKIGTIAGCMVTNGKVFSNSQIRVIRDGVVLYSGLLSSLKRFKDDVKEVSKGYDCGMQVKNYDAIEENDIIEAFKEVEVRKKLK